MLEELNPWWIGEKDPDIEEYESLKVKYKPEWINNLSLEPFSLNFVIGPRRTGKTTGLKLLIHALLNTHEPHSICYLSCELIENHRDLKTVLERYESIKERRNIKHSYIFLDEITLVPEWWRTIKYFVDRHRFANDVVVLSGSASLMLSQHMENFGGRMGHGKIVEVLPLAFWEYYDLFTERISEKKIKTLFQRYLETGGFLSVINGMLRINEYISLLKADIMRIGRSTEITRNILRSILESAPSPVSFHSLAKSSGISVNSVREYIEILKGLFVIADVLYMGMDKKVDIKKERKFTIRDPFMVKSIAGWTDTEIRKDFLYEWIVQEHVRRIKGDVFYFKNHYEIDCVSGDLMVEVKSGKVKKRYPKKVRIVDSENIPMFLMELGGKYAEM